MWFALLFCSYLCLCSVQDYCFYQVYDCMHLWILVPACFHALQFCSVGGLGLELIIYGLVQGLVFRRMYGDADVMCFLTCALSLAEKGILVWTCHMGITFLILGIVQYRKGNISRSGNLKRPVPLIPYITIAYLFVF